MEPARHFILGTAGHIDHGKTSLVKALTGTDTDRLPEEQRRGMTIELGFAELDLGDVRFGVVDVPGHEKFVRTMVSGATGIDLALIVVACDDSVMPQTIEHVEILQLLGVRRVVVALSKADLVDADMIALVREEIGNLLAATGMQAAEMIPVSSVTGEGIDELKATLRRIGLSLEQRSNAGPFRMAIDRVFTIQGRGTVVTGSVFSGRVLTGDSLELHPDGGVCRVRDVQSHGRSEERLLAGQRAALNLIGVERTSVERGFELATAGYLTPSAIIDASVIFVPSRARTEIAGQKAKVAPRRAHPRNVRVGIGAAEQMAKLLLLDDHTDGDRGGESHVRYAQLRLAAPIVAAHGQRFIIRDESATRTIGGGIVLRPVARRARRSTVLATGGAPAPDRLGLDVLRSGDEAARVEEVWRYAGFEPLTELQIAARAGVDPARVPALVEELRECRRVTAIDAASAASEGARTALLPVSTWKSVVDRATAQLGKYHAAHPDQPGCPIDSLTGWIDRKTVPGVGKALVANMLAEKRLHALGRYVALPAFAPALSAQDEKCFAAMLTEFREAGFRPPLVGELKVVQQASLQRVTRLLKLAVATGQLVQVDSEIHLHADIERQLREIINRLIEQGRPVTVAQVREATDSSRKFVVPFLEYLDRVGFTRRVGDVRVRAAPG